MKILDREMWSKQIMIAIGISMCILIWNILMPSGIACIVNGVFFCIIMLQGYMFGDKYAEYTKDYMEDSKEKEKWFALCFANGLVPLLYVFFLKIHYIGIRNMFMFVVGCLLFVFITVFVVKKILKNCKKLFAECKIMKSILVVWWIVFFGASYLCLNYYCDLHYNTKTISVVTIDHKEAFKIPIQSTKYVYFDNLENEHVVNHTYVALFEWETSDKLTVKSGAGLFGLGYQDVVVNQTRLLERLAEDKAGIRYK